MEYFYSDVLLLLLTASTSSTIDFKGTNKIFKLDLKHLTETKPEQPKYSSEVKLLSITVFPSLTDRPVKPVNKHPHLDPEMKLLLRI